MNEQRPTDAQRAMIGEAIRAEYAAHHIGKPPKHHRLLRAAVRRSSKRGVGGRRLRDPAGLDRGLTAAEAIQMRVRMAKDGK